MSEMEYFDSSEDSEDIRRRERVRNIKTTSEEYAAMMERERLAIQRKREELARMVQTDYNPNEDDDNNDNNNNDNIGEDDSKMNGGENGSGNENCNNTNNGESITSLINANFIDLESKLEKEFKNINKRFDNINNNNIKLYNKLNNKINKQTYINYGILFVLFIIFVVLVYIAMLNYKIVNNTNFNKTEL